MWKLGCYLPPPLLKFLATRLVATASICQNLVVCFLFDLCDTVVFSSSRFYFGLTKFDF